MTKTECIDIFNAMLKGTPVSFQDKLIVLFSDYLIDNNIKNSDQLINFIIQNPQFLSSVLPKIVDFYCIKYNISILNTVVRGQLNPILYYE